MNYQSHQSGIETCKNVMLSICIFFYQSHQSGIETVIKRSLVDGVWTTNRTNLELKQYKQQPFWVQDNSTNRTNLELKLQKEIANTLHRLNYQSHQSGIETRHKGRSPVRRGLPIAPIWN